MDMQNYGYQKCAGENQLYDAAVWSHGHNMQFEG
jgi:hypothetical protein